MMTNSEYRELGETGVLIERRRVRVLRMRTLVVAAAVVAAISVASGWAVAGLVAYVAALAPLIVLSF
jgi:hypothetical protein